MVLWKGRKHDGGKLLDGPKEPRWGCSCGFGNFANRLCCFRCHALAPISVQNRAQQEEAKFKKDKKEQKQQHQQRGGKEEAKSKEKLEVDKLRKQVAQLRRQCEEHKVSANESEAPDELDTSVAGKIKHYEGLIQAQAGLGLSTVQAQGELEELKKANASAPSTVKLAHLKKKAEQDRDKAVEKRDEAIQQLKEAEELVVKSNDKVAKLARELQEAASKGNEVPIVYPGTVLHQALEGISEDKSFLEVPGMAERYSLAKQAMEALRGFLEVHEDFRMAKDKDNAKENAPPSVQPPLAASSAATAAMDTSGFDGALLAEAWNSIAEEPLSEEKKQKLHTALQDAKRRKLDAAKQLG